MKSQRAWRVSSGVAALVLIIAAATAPAAPAAAALPGASALLTRAPYLTDLTTGSVRITWATSTQSIGSVSYGTAGNCTANTAQSTTLGNPITINGITEYQSSVMLTGLAAGTRYCYRVFTGGTSPVDLLGSNPSPLFTTLDQPGSSAPFSFVVFGDTGDTTNSGSNTGTLNQNQAALYSQIANSGARFALSTGDIAYPSGSQTNFGDLNQTGPNVSAFFGPQYWAVPGQSMPLYPIGANHGKNATFLSIFPQTTLAAASGGVSGLVSYPSYYGSNAGDFATTYYAFSTGNVRFYVLDAAWQDSNVGSADGGPCGSYCAKYQMDYAGHWTTTSAEYQWLAGDLAAHPGGLKMAVFHFPLHSDDKKQPSDAYLQNAPGSSGSLEQLLHDNGVNLVFNGHSHSYQRFVSSPGGVPSYVSGGGGGVLVPVANATGGCSTMDAYALGWSYSSGGSVCGAAARPTSDSQVHHFLKVTVNGSTVTVTPTNALGQTFDAVTYNFAADATAPTAPVSPNLTQASNGQVTLAWTGATDNIGVAAYDVYRNGAWLGTTTGTARSYVDRTAVSGGNYLYEVRARDLAGNTTGATTSVGNVDTVPPTAPANVQAVASGSRTVSLSWNASSDNVGVTGYTVRRDGAAAGTTTSLSYVDSGLVPGSTHQYTVTAFDAVGNTSTASAPVTVTTAPDTTPPSVPSSLAATAVTSSSVSLSWNASTDDVGLLRYDVLRNGALVGSTESTSFVDPTVSADATYSYVVRAVDVSGNTASSNPLSVTTRAASDVLSDGFESGLGQWGPVNGIGVQTSLVHSGSYAVRETSSGAATYAYASLPGSYNELWLSGWVNVASRSTSVNFFGFRSPTGASIVNVYVDTNGRLSLRNNAGAVTTYSTTIVPTGSWHQVVLHAVVNGTSSSLDVSYDGVAVPGLTLTGQNLGTNSISRIQLGETSTGRTYDVAIDDLQVSSSAPVTEPAPPDTTPPSAPASLAATAITSSSVSLSWDASTDDVGVVRYDVLRDGVALGSSTSTGFVDTTVADGVTYSYVVRAVDASGNTASSPPLAVSTAYVLSDDFESGGLGQWGTVSGIGVQNSLVHSGSYAVRETSTGTATYAYAALPGRYSDLYMSGWVYVSSHSTSVNFFGFRSSTGALIVSVYVNPSGQLSLRNNIGMVTTYSTTVLPTGSWHRIVLHAVVNGTSSSLDVSYDGVAVPGLTLTGQNLGTNPIVSAQLGENTTGRTYDVAIDDLQVSSSAPGTVPVGLDITPPSAPSSLVASAVTSSSVSLSWDPSTDDVGVVRYDVLRDGVVVGSSTSAGFADTTVAAGSTYSYVVRAVDAGGNTASSPALSVTTPQVLSDDFESGVLGQWGTVSGIGVQNSLVHSGSYAVRETSTGTATYAYASLPGSYSDLYISGWVYVSSHTTSVNFFGFRSSTGALIVSVYVNPSGQLSLRNNIGMVTTYSTTVLPTGSWHRIVLHAVVNGTSSSLDVSYDGVAVPDLTLTGQNLGTNPINRVQLGENTTGRTYDVAIDDLQVSTSLL